MNPSNTSAFQPFDGFLGALPVETQGASTLEMDSVYAAVAFDAQRQRVAVGRKEMRIYAWPSGQLLSTFDTGLGPQRSMTRQEIFGLRFALDGQALVWQEQRGILLQRLGSEGSPEILVEGRQKSVSFSDDGGFVAWKTQYDTAMVMEIASGACWESPTASFGLLRVGLGPNAKRVVLASTGGVEVFEVGDESGRRLFCGWTRLASAPVSISADGRFVAAFKRGESSYELGALRVWDVERGRTLAIKGLDKTPCAPIFDADSQTVSVLTAIHEQGKVNVVQVRCADGVVLQRHEHAVIKGHLLEGQTAMLGPDLLMCRGAVNRSSVLSVLELFSGAVVSGPERTAAFGVQSMRVLDDGAIVGRHHRMGLLRWTAPWSAPRSCAEARGDTIVYSGGASPLLVHSNSGDLSAHEPESLATVWSRRDSGANTRAAVWGADGAHVFTLTKDRWKDTFQLEARNPTTGSRVGSGPSFEHGTYRLVDPDPQGPVMLLSATQAWFINRQSLEVERSVIYKASCRSLLAVSDDGLLVLLNSDGGVVVVETGSGQLRCLVPRVEKGRFTRRFVADGQLLLSCSADTGLFLLHSTRSGRLIARSSFNGKLSGVLCGRNTLWLDALGIRHRLELDGLSAWVPQDEEAWQATTSDNLSRLRDAVYEAPKKRWRAVTNILDAWSDEPEVALDYLQQAQISGPMPAPWLERVLHGEPLMWTALVSSLKLDKRALSPESLQALFGAGGFSALRSLTLDYSNAKVRTFEAAAQALAPHTEVRLEELSLKAVTFRPESVQALASAPGMAGLKRLDLRACGKPGLLLGAAAGKWNLLESLSVDGFGKSQPCRSGTTAFLQTPGHCDKLQSLIINGHPADLNSIFSTASWPALRTLAFSWDDSGEGLAQLLQSQALAGLEELRVYGSYHLLRRDVELLLQAPFFGTLKKLVVSYHHTARDTHKARVDKALV